MWRLLLCRGDKDADEEFYNWNTALKDVLGRIEYLKKSRRTTMRRVRRRIVGSLYRGEEEGALLRAVHLIKEERADSANELIRCCCQRIINMLFSILRQRECPDYLSTDIQSLTFASSKCLDIPELQTVKTIFEKKFGTDFVAVAINLLPGCNVHQEMRSLLATEPPTLAKKLETLKKIAKENNIDWSYSKETLEYEHWDKESEFEDSNEYLYPAPTLSAPHIHPKLPDYENLSRFFHDLFTEQKRGSIEKLT